MVPLSDLESTERLVLVMVGLPARGKTYTARKIAHYLQWQGRSARVFNVGNYRRKRLGAHQPSAFFDPDNVEGSAGRRKMAEAAMDDLLAWLQAEGQVAIYDATNTTRERRTWARASCESIGAHVLFIESVCNDERVLQSNIRETKLRSPDYRDVDPEVAVADFMQRLAHYERAYEPMDEGEGSWVRIIDAGRQLQLNQIQGYLPSRLVTLLMNLHLIPRTILLTRHGQSTYNLENRIGGNPELTPRGEAYANNLAEFLDGRFGDELVVLNSTLRRADRTGEVLGRLRRAWKVLDEIDAGIYDSWTYADIAARAPEEATARKADKLRYRYPRGESYIDVIRRVDPVIIELERQRRPVLVIAHNAVIRALYGYFLNIPVRDVPHQVIPLHTVLELTPRAYGVAEARHPLGPIAPPASSG